MSIIVEKAAEVLAAHQCIVDVADDGKSGACLCDARFDIPNEAIELGHHLHVAEALADAKLLIAAFPDGTAGTLTGDLLTDMAAYAGRLRDRAEAAEQQVVALDRMLAEAINAHRDLHRIYPSTSACLGGISGQAMTPHCGEVCRNSDKHTSENDRWERVERAYFRRKDGDPTWADLDPEARS